MSKGEMIEKYGDKIVFSKLQTHKTVVCFRDVGENILKASWYASRSNNDEE